MRTVEDHPHWNRRVRVRLRGAVAVILGVAVILAALRPQLREACQWAERRVRARLHRGELFEHLDTGRTVAEEFLAAVHAGRLDTARRMMTSGCRRRLAPPGFEAFVAAHPVLTGPCAVRNGFIKAPEGWPISEYEFQGGRDQERPSTIKVILISEHGEVRVDRLAVDEPD